MGYADYEEMKYYAERGLSIFKGGYINTELIEASLIITSQLIANAIKANTLNINDKFIVKTDGSVEMNGILHSLGRSTELVISDGYVRIMYNGNDVAKFSVNEVTGMPEISMYNGNRSCVITAEKILLSTGGASASFLTIDASVLGYGMIKKKSDGTLYLADNEYEWITVAIIASPTNGGTTIPSPSQLHMVMRGKTEIVEAVPNDGYEFESWSDGGSQKHTVTWSTEGQTLVAYFKKKGDEKYTLSLNVSPSNGGTTTGAGAYTKGTSVSINATPNSGWRFVRWSDGMSQRHTVTMDSNKSLTAYFEKYTVTGEEIFSGTNLTSSSYWNTRGDASVNVSNGLATIRFGENGGYAFFNKGYLGSKLEQGHRYRLSITVKESDTSSLGYIAVGLYNVESSVLTNISGIEAIEVSKSYMTYLVDFIMDEDSSVQTALGIYTNNSSYYIKSISLKEV